MAELVEPQEAETEAPPPASGRLAGLGRGAIKALGHFLPKLGLFLFIIAVPVLLAAYPAWILSAHLLDYSRASTIEAELTAIDIRTVEIGQDQASPFEARKHYDVVFHFKGDKGQQYAAIAELSWPQSGLKRKLNSQYVIGDPYTLYLLPNNTVAIDEMVATSSYYRLTGLMGLAFLGSALFFMLWKRLAHRLPATMPGFPAAMQKSLMLGQLVALLLAGLLAVAITYQPLVIGAWLFVGGYWGLTAFLALSLRLLVFEDTVPPPAPEPEQPRRAR